MPKRKRTPEQEAARKEYMRGYYLKNKEKQLAVQKSRYDDGGRERQRTKRLQRDYGLTQEQHDDMLEAQHFQCAICGTAAPGGRDDVWHVDHCHTSGAVRGLLCCDCNLGLGKFKDNAASLAKAIEYLNVRTNRHAEGRPTASA